MQLLLCNRPYVPVTINGTGPWWFLFDSGSVGISVETRLLEEMELCEFEPGSTRVEVLRVDQVERRDVPINVTDLRSVSDVCGRVVPGMLGMWLVESTRLTLDYPAKAGAWLEAEAGGALPSGTEVPATVANHYALVPVHVNDQGPFPFLVDTGASSSIISLDLAEQLKLELNSPGWSRGAADARRRWRASVDQLRVGREVKERFPVSIMDCSHLCEYTSRLVHGYVGHDFLSCFRVTFALPDGCIVLS